MNEIITLGGFSIMVMVVLFLIFFVPVMHYREKTRYLPKKLKVEKLYNNINDNIRYRINEEEINPEEFYNKAAAMGILGFVACGGPLLYEYRHPTYKEWFDRNLKG